jgi:site-specific recombinase XerD
MGRRMNRVLRRPASMRPVKVRIHEPRRVGRTWIDFSLLVLPADVRDALAQAFWGYIGARSSATLCGYWHHLRIFARFVAETGAVRHLRDVNSETLLRYVEWLNRQRAADGGPWMKGTRHSTYMSLRALIQWLQRCRPGLLEEIEFPCNPFPWKNRDRRRIETIPALQLREILKACERDIETYRALRSNGKQARAATDVCNPESISSLGELLNVIQQRHGGILPPWIDLARPVRQALKRYGGGHHVSLCLYPRAESLLPYYLAILIHTAGNPHAIAELTCECLQSIPLLDDRELLVWRKGRAGVLQRRAFSRTHSLEPPTLVREIIEWTAPLRAYAKAADRQRLFLFRATRGIRAFSPSTVNAVLPGSFLVRHDLQHFSLASIRASVLTAFYRGSGDLRQVKAIANHAQISTTIGYITGPHIGAQNRLRVATLQNAFLGHLEHPTQKVPAPDTILPHVAPSGPAPGRVTSMFGFDCKDPFSGIAPGTRPGELCTYFLGCFTCPNAVVTGDPACLARLLQAREHLRAASYHLHPARWEAVYAPSLRILEEDILTRFSARELAAATPLSATLPPLPELR